MPKASVVWNHSFENNSGKPEPIGTKFYRETSALVWIPCKLLAPSAKRAQNGGEKSHFANFIVSAKAHRFTHFPLADFREICTQNPNWCRHKFKILGEHIYEIFPTRNHLPPNPQY